MTVPGNLSSPLLATADAGAAAGVGISKSVRFNDADSTHLTRTPSSAGNRKKYTWSTWVKRTSSASWILTVGTSADTESIYFNGGHLVMARYVGSFQYYIETEASFLDFSSWYHIIVAHDHSLSTSTDRIKLYVNGVRITDFKSGASFPPQNSEYETNNTENHKIGRYANAYLADLYFIDGSQLDETSFGAYDDNGVWQAATYSGTFGTNGFHLFDFANESTLGHDSSGNENDFTANNLLSADASGGAPSVTGTNIFPAESTAIANLWDGQVSSYPGDFLTASDGGVITISWPTAITGVTSIQYYSFNGNDRHNVNEGGWSGNSGSGGGYKTAYSGSAISLTKLQLQKNDQASFVKIGAIKINATILTTSNYQSDSDTTDIYFDVPVNGDSSDDTGAGGELSSNYCVLNPLDQNTATLTNGNLEAQIDSDGARFVRGTIAVSSGKHYWEFTTSSSNNMALGVVETTGTGNLSDSGSYYYYANGGALYGNSSGKASSWSGSTLAVGDVLGVALDMDNGTLQYYKNGSLIGTAWTGLTGKTLAPAIGTGGGSNNKTICNFGQRAFAYGNAGTNRPAATFKALCTSNLPTPTIADGSAHFESKLYTGNSSTNALTMSNSSMSPDWVYIHSRSTGGDHEMFDVVRGANQVLESNSTNQSNSVSNTLTSFDSNGFTLGSSSLVNDNNVTYVAWCWDGGSTSATNTVGSVTSTVRANAAAGFSIVKWSGGSGGTVGHSLGAKPHLIISHKINGSGQWPTYNSEIGAQKYMYFNSTIEARTYAHFWNNTEPTSSVFSVGSDSDVSGGTHIAYCFAPVAGYQAMGKYDGTGSSPGEFVYTGFKPALVMIKRITNAESWVFYDTSRDTHNPTATRAWADLNYGDSTNTSHYIDILSNGFKVRSGGGLLGASSNEYFYWAIAENPFQANGGLAR